VLNRAVVSPAGETTARSIKGEAPLKPLAGRLGLTLEALGLAFGLHLLVTGDLASRLLEATAHLVAGTGGFTGRLAGGLIGLALGLQPLVAGDLASGFFDGSLDFVAPAGYSDAPLLLLNRCFEWRTARMPRRSPLSAPPGSPP